MTTKTRRKIRKLQILDRYSTLKTKFKNQGIRGGALIQKINRMIEIDIADSKNLFRDTGEISYIYEILTYLRLYRPTTMREYEKKIHSISAAVAMIQMMRVRKNLS